MELSGKNVVYVGGFGGIGKEVCKQLIQNHVAHLYILDLKINSEVLTSFRALNSNTEVHFQQYDVTKGLDNARRALAIVLNEISHFDILVNGAGIADDSRLEEMIQINLSGLICTTTAAVELWDKRNGGNGGLIINIASILGLAYLKETIVYSTTKAAVVAFTRALALQEHATGVSTFVICPGITDTPILLDLHPYLNITSYEEFREKFNKAPHQSPEEFAVQFLKLIPTAENGSVWIIASGKSQLVTMPIVINLPEVLQ